MKLAVFANIPSGVKRETHTHQLRWPAGGTIANAHRLRWPAGGTNVEAHRLRWPAGGTNADAHQLRSSAGGTNAETHSLRSLAGGTNADAHRLRWPAGGMNEHRGALYVLVAGQVALPLLKKRRGFDCGDSHAVIPAGFRANRAR